VWTADRLRLPSRTTAAASLDWPDEAGAGGHAEAGPAGHGLQSLRERCRPAAAPSGPSHDPGAASRHRHLPTAPAAPPASRPTTPPTTRPTTRSPS
jgi:hypothetical protein